MNSRAAFNQLEMPLSGTSVDHVPHLLGGVSARLRAQLHALASASMGVLTLLLV